MAEHKCGRRSSERRLVLERLLVAEDVCCGIRVPILLQVHGHLNGSQLLVDLVLLHDECCLLLHEHLLL